MTTPPILENPRCFPDCTPAGPDLDGVRADAGPIPARHRNGRDPDPESAIVGTVRRIGLHGVLTGPALVGMMGCLAGCFAAMPGSGPEDEVAIAEFNRRYLQAINEGDIDALADLTTDGHMMIASGGAPLVGKQALVDAMTGAFQAFDFEESWAPEETVVSGDLAYQRGTFVVVATPRSGGDASRTAGNFLRIYRRQPDGAWFMVRDMFNSTAPR